MASLKPTISGGIVVVENGGGIVVVENERASLQKPQTVLVDDLVDGLSLQKEVVLVDGLKDIQSAQKDLVDLISEGELDVGSPRIQQVYVSADVSQSWMSTIPKFIPENLGFVNSCVNEWHLRVRELRCHRSVV